MARPHFLQACASGRGEASRLVNASTGELVAPILETAFDSASRRRGLLGRDTLDAAVAFVIAPCNAIHTFRMRFPIDVLFVSREGEVLKRVVNLRPGRLSASWRAFAVIECCANHPGIAGVRPGHRLRVE